MARSPRLRQSRYTSGGEQRGDLQGRSATPVNSYKTVTTKTTNVYAGFPTRDRSWISVASARPYYTQARCVQMTLLPTWQQVLQSTFQHWPAAAGGAASAAIPVQTTAANRATATNLSVFLIVHLLGAEVTTPGRVRAEISADGW
jgi:hypothetical protein